MGRAIADYWKTRKASKLRVFSPMFEEDEIPLTTLFRSYNSMAEIERKALDMAKGTMKKRGVKKVLEQDFFTLDGQFDTILMLMNSIGIVGILERLPKFFKQIDKILAPGGQVLCDSSDISYVFETEDGIIELPDNMSYYGEHSFQMQYKDTIGEPFDWLYIDADTLKEKAVRNGYAVEVVAEGEHYDYLARITKIQTEL